MTTISVVIPTYNRPDQLLGRALPSVLAQTMNDQEIIVVGDGTDEDTILAMREFVRQNDNAQFYNLDHFAYPEDHERAWGLYGLNAINYGLDQATGDWIAVLGDDDEFTPDHHATLLEAAERTGADHVYGLSNTYKNGAFTGQQYGAWPPGDGQLATGANIFRASMGYRFDLNCWDRGLTGDADLWTRMRKDGVKFHFEPRVVHHYWRSWPP